MSTTSLKDTKRQNWVIAVANYGSFLFFGTEKEADDRRAAKAEWEHAAARMREAEAGETSDDKIHRCKNHLGFLARYGRHACDCKNCLREDERKTLTRP